MADFKIAHKITADCEGGYVNDPKDAGGETIFGIARNMWKDLPLWQIMDKHKAQCDVSTKDGRKKLESLCLADESFVEQKDAFYKSQFWDKVKGDEITDQNVANNIYDFAVNAGTKQAVKSLQRTLGITDDGAFGSGTLAACNSSEARILNNNYCVARENFYKDLVKRKPQNEKFLNGWLSRVKRFYV